MRIALAQINPTIGDFAGNEGRILEAARRGEAEKLDLVVFPELSIPGYPPRDLLLKNDFIAKNLAVLQRLAAASGKTALMVGYAGENKSSTGRPCTNEAALLQSGKITATRQKSLLPTYDVFDEDRYFQPGKGQPARGHQRPLLRTEHLRGYLERRGFLAAPPLSASIPLPGWFPQGRRSS